MFWPLGLKARRAIKRWRQQLILFQRLEPDRYFGWLVNLITSRPQLASIKVLRSVLHGVRSQRSIVVVLCADNRREILSRIRIHLLLTTRCGLPRGYFYEVDAGDRGTSGTSYNICARPFSSNALHISFLLRYMRSWPYKISDLVAKYLHFHHPMAT